MSDPPQTGTAGGNARNANDGNNNATNSATNTEQTPPFASQLRADENHVLYGRLLNNPMQIRTHHPPPRNPIKIASTTAPSATFNATPAPAAFNNDSNTPQTTNTMQGRVGIAVGGMNLHQQFVALAMPTPPTLPTLPPFAAPVQVQTQPPAATANRVELPWVCLCVQENPAHKQRCKCKKWRGGG